MKKNLPQLCIFTPAYNADKTIKRTYESLCDQTCKDFEWLIIDDGSTDNTKQLVGGWIKESVIPIKYIYKENGGLHTGYNVAIENIENELCVCIDADDYMPQNAVEIILDTWNKKGNSELAGLIGLDYSAKTKEPIGGLFKYIKKTYHFIELSSKLKHKGDMKMVVRTELLKPFVPIVSFKGEKNFNPIYLFYKIDPNLEYILINENLCFVDYQSDGMSANIFHQYKNSPRSFAELRKVALLHPKIKRRRKIIESAHLVSSAILAKDFNVLRNSPKKRYFFLSVPIGILFFLVIKCKTR